MPWDENDKLAVMNRMRRQIIVHSVIYYRFNRNLISDGEYDQLCQRLFKMQKEYPEIAEQAVFPDDFKDYDPSTGMNFADHPWGIQSAWRLLTSVGQKVGDD